MITGPREMVGEAAGSAVGRCVSGGWRSGSAGGGGKAMEDL
jgi:hypothetical protein